MNMVGHDHPGSELIKMPSVLAIHQSIGYYTRYAGIAQPNRPESSFIHFTVQDEKSSARGWSCARRRMQEPGSWDGAGQTPGDKQEGCLREIGMPVGKLSAVEHNELAGESACPTYSACTRQKSQENVETPVAGESACPTYSACMREKSPENVETPAAGFQPTL